MGAPFRTMRPAGRRRRCAGGGARGASRRARARRKRNPASTSANPGAAGRGGRPGRRMRAIVVEAPPSARRPGRWPTGSSLARASGFAGALYAHARLGGPGPAPHLAALCPDEDRHAAAARGAQPRQPAGAADGRSLMTGGVLVDRLPRLQPSPHRPGRARPARRHAARDVRRPDHEPALTLARRLAALLGPGLDRVFYGFRLGGGGSGHEDGAAILAQPGRAGAAASWRSRAATTATPSAPWRSAIRKRACTACSGAC